MAVTPFQQPGQFLRGHQGQSVQAPHLRGQLFCALCAHGYPDLAAQTTACICPGKSTPGTQQVNVYGLAATCGSRQHQAGEQAVPSWHHYSFLHTKRKNDSGTSATDRSRMGSCDRGLTPGKPSILKTIRAEYKSRQTDKPAQSPANSAQPC